VRIEAKIADGTSVKLEKSQRLWCQPNCGTPIPQLWMIATRTLDKCWLLEHADVVSRAEVNTGHFLNLWPHGKGQPDACNIDELVMEIITWARKQTKSKQGAE
jgi:hypothetical protein